MEPGAFGKRLLTNHPIRYDEHDGRRHAKCGALASGNTNRGDNRAQPHGRDLTFHRNIKRLGKNREPSTGYGLLTEKA